MAFRCLSNVILQVKLLYIAVRCTKFLLIAYVQHFDVIKLRYKIMYENCTQTTN